MTTAEQNRIQAKKYLDDRTYSMEVLCDSGVNRTLKFMAEGQGHNGYFMVTTWPGHLAISGDMGTFVFARIDDMVEFFAGDGINPGYWSEKCESESVFGDGMRCFDADSFKAVLQEEVDSATEHMDEDEAIEAKEAVRSHFEYVEEDETGMVEALRSFYTDLFELCDFNWRSCTPFTFHYLFACYAINYACNTYLNSKKNTEAVQ